MLASTAKCVYCLTAKAEMWTGYVRAADTGEELIAGWCREHEKRSRHTDGFCGQYFPAMGMTDE